MPVHTLEGPFVRATDAAYSRLFDAEYAHVRRTVHVMVGSRPVAEDIAQDAFVQALLHWRRVSRYDRPDAWVRRVAIRLAMRHMRRERNRLLVESLATVGGDGGAPLDIDLLDAVRTLPPRQRAVLALFYYEDRPMAEVADLLGISESTGFVHLHRARHRLAELLGEVDADVVGPQAE
jgi:RNA polymerase sigma-70 factor (ECF subfamily)